jgi:serine/threonine protein kinase
VDAKNICGVHQLLAALNHPNIADIHGLEEADGLRYLVLEYVPGETLAERLQRGTLTVKETLEVGKQIAEARYGPTRSAVECVSRPGSVTSSSAGHTNLTYNRPHCGLAIARRLGATT